MKQITAYLRADVIERVLAALEGAEESHFTAVGEARAVMGSTRPDLARLEIVCPDPGVPALVDLVRALASTGREGDGMIFISAVEEAVRISDGRRASDVIPL